MRPRTQVAVGLPCPPRLSGRYNKACFTSIFILSCAPASRGGRLLQNWGRARVRRTETLFSSFSMPFTQNLKRSLYIPKRSSLRTRPSLRSVSKTLSSMTKTLRSDSETLLSMAKTLRSDPETLSSMSKTLRSDPETVSSMSKTLRSDSETLLSMAKTLRSDSETVLSMSTRRSSGERKIRWGRSFSRRVSMQDLISAVGVGNDMDLCFVFNQYRYA